MVFLKKVCSINHRIHHLVSYYGSQDQWKNCNLLDHMSRFTREWDTAEPGQIAIQTSPKLKAVTTLHKK
jgi:hypothetical protein